MKLTFIALGSYPNEGASRSYAGIDDTGDKQILAVEWMPDLVPLVRERSSVYTVDSSCLTQAQVALVAAFIKARINNKLPLAGAELEV